MGSTHHRAGQCLGSPSRAAAFLIRYNDVIRCLLGALLTFGAINAFAGGYYGLAGAKVVPLEWLAGSPFSDYVIPSLILFVVVGGVFSFAAIAVFMRSLLARELSSQPRFASRQARRRAPVGRASCAHWTASFD